MKSAESFFGLLDAIVPSLVSEMVLPCRVAAVPWALRIWPSSCLLVFKLLRPLPSPLMVIAESQKNVDRKDPPDDGIKMPSSANAAHAPSITSLLPIPSTNSSTPITPQAQQPTRPPRPSCTHAPTPPQRPPNPPPPKTRSRSCAPTTHRHTRPRPQTSCPP